MDNRKEPKITERGVVIIDAGLRKHVRAKLKADLIDARVNLSPERLWQYMLARNKAKAKDVMVDAGAAARKNAPVIGAAGLGIALIAARRPISKWIMHLGKAAKTGQTEIDRNKDG